MMAPYGWVLWGWCPMMVLMCEVLYLTCLHLRTPFCFSSFFLIEKFYPVTCAGWQFQTREVHSQSEATSSKGSGAYPNTNPVHSPPPQKPRGMKKFMSLFSPEMMLVCRVVINLWNTILHTIETQNKWTISVAWPVFSVFLSVCVCSCFFSQIEQIHNKYELVGKNYVRLNFL
jgi:hypothetical protein